MNLDRAGGMRFQPYLSKLRLLRQYPWQAFCLQYIQNGGGVAGHN